ncbi:hypothetical protein [Roseateles sp.]|uniref:hypothetical protein n=1 Tax=Roseateles sp. TaxID=1971397 RepID=UPI0032662906
MRFLLAGFAGAIKALDSHSLDASIGSDSVNQRPRVGELTPWRQPTTVATVPAGRKTIYRMGRDTLSDSSYWLSWTTIVHAIRGFLANDSTERTYFTGSGAPNVTDNIIGLAGAPYPTAARELGVPALEGVSTITETTPGTGTDRLTFYTDVFITEKGEESKPRIISSITSKPGTVIEIASLSAALAGNYGIRTRRFYRSEAGTSGQGEFFFLMDMPAANTTATDAGLDVGAAIMATTGWDAAKRSEVPHAALGRVHRRQPHAGRWCRGEGAAPGRGGREAASPVGSGRRSASRR